MELAHLQRALQGLIRGTYQATDDTPPYLRMVSASEHLAMVRDVVRWWRSFQAARFCVLTSTLLRRRGQFDASIDAFLRMHRISPFIEEFGAAFLVEMTTHPDGLVRSVAQFELALLKVKKGDREDHSVHWDQDPAAVLESLIKDGPLSSPAIGVYRTVVTNRVPDLFYTEAWRPPQETLMPAAKKRAAKKRRSPRAIGTWPVPEKPSRKRPAAKKRAARP